MKRILYFAAICCMTLGTFTSCEMKEKEIGTLSNMFGRWRNDSNPQQYTVFYSDAAETGWYWGKEWDERDGVLESDLEEHGNGWFMWKKGSSSLVMRMMMSISQAEPAVEIQLVSLTDSKMTVKEGAHTASMTKIAAK